MMITVQALQGDHHHHQPQQLVGSAGVSRALSNADRVEPFTVKPEPTSLSLLPFNSHDTSEVDEDLNLTFAHQMYKTGNYKLALQYGNTVYEKNPLRSDNLLLLGAIYYQLHDFDMCIAKNEEALQIDPHFAECYGNMANAWKEKGNIDLAIRYYLVAIELRPNFADAWSNLASAYMRKGRLNEAAQCCRQALTLNPLMVDAHSNLGNLMKAQGLVQEAYSCYLEALRIQPTFAIAWSNLAGLFMESGDFNRALQYYKEAVKLKPSFPDAYLNLGNVYKALGLPQDAIACYQRALQSRPNYAMAFGNLASTYYEQGQLDLAILHYKQAVSIDPKFLEAYNNLGNALKDVGRVEEAVQCYNQCLALQSNHPQALTNLGNIYMEWNMVAAAASYYKATLSVTTGLSAPFNNLAIIYKQQGNYTDAISCYNEVLRIDPLAADGLVNRGNTYKEIAYKDSGHVEAAMNSYKKALLLRSDFPEATCNLLHTLQCVCSWEDRDKMFAEVEGIIRKQINISVLPSVQPFHAIAYPIDPILALEISRKYAAHCSLIASRFSLPAFSHPAPVPIKCESGYERLRIGYVSSDFGNHPLSHLMGSVFGMHNTKTVEVFCYALSPNDGTEWRQRIQSEVEHFVDVSSMSSDMIAKMINKDKIHILVNLNGYTKGARNEIFAMQPAPIQVSYMGFPGTTGAAYIDYLVTDEFVSPLHYSHIYSEKLVHLPHCYFVNDYKQKNQDVLDPICQPKRSDYGLPDDKFIFACFNQLYKMDPEIFNTWCNILKRVPNSALWLLRFPAAGETRLRAYAASQGVQPDQIIFTDVAMKNEHIRRSALADLFLDTLFFLFLLLGLYAMPILQAQISYGQVCQWLLFLLRKWLPGLQGSLCLATGLGDEMIVSSMKEYEERAVSLALNRPKLQAVTNKLKAVRMTCPLFDTYRWVRNLERSYFKMWNLQCAGQQPQHFKVSENDMEFPYDRLVE
ncbi:Tetratricopeptide repeat (TPR)-like superfamily protein [Quillaja saponaria]|uniref:protein O-GlcNAc transferase n=1 Tax=Quillaja saponaria TaxID=32244 RepID=A0AAD7QBD2_QUISA|nr:Tetratricopeptide repeat (TPR)-like superfamily protein [Quillaja saponaria]